MANSLKTFILMLVLIFFVTVTEVNSSLLKQRDGTAGTLVCGYHSLPCCAQYLKNGKCSDRGQICCKAGQKCEMGLQNPRCVSRK